MDDYKSERKALIIAFAINTSFIIVELVGAWYSGSLTLLSDAIHMITDSSSILLAIIASYIAMIGADSKRTFGYHRIEVISGLTNGVFLLVTVVYILFSSYQRYIEPTEVDGALVIIIGFVGLMVNLSAAYFLHGENESVNIQGAYLHLISDALGSIAAILSGIVMILTGYYIVDILFAIIISALIAYSVKGMITKSINILLQGVPGDKNVNELKKILLRIDGVIDVHHIHIWSLNSKKDAMTAHVVVDENVKNSEVLKESLKSVEDYGIEHPTIQIEKPDFKESEYDCHYESEKAPK